MIYLCYLAAAVGLFVLTTCCYRLLSKGLSRSARGQQITRFSIASLLAVVPLAVARVDTMQVNLLLMGVVSVCWMVTFPLLDFVANRRQKSEIDNRMDFAAGLYMFGALSSSYLALTSLFPGWLYVVDTFYAAIELPLIVICVFQICYYAIYGGSVTHDGLKLVLDTNVNEVIEFFRSFPAWAMVAGLVGMILFVILWFFWSLAYSFVPADLNWLTVSAEVLLFAVCCSLLFKGKKGAFRRSGISTLYCDNLDHSRKLSLYSSRRNVRLAKIAPVRQPGETEKRGEGEKGRSYILVIGESASRDYMEAFTPTAPNHDTTPWLSRMAAENADRTFIFPNAYSCHFQTVPTLERALTQMNQYNGKSFVDSVSVVELAQSLGLKVYWYSNQGHIGVNDTPVTLVAESSDRAAWTSQQLNHQPYDEELMGFLPEIDPAADKLIVLHLKGSHFTYSNRYPDTREHFDSKGGKDYVAAYRNSIRYTDQFLNEVYDFAMNNLNLQAMVYCSDHADVPDRRRSPNFDGFAQVRIPLAVVVSRDYAGRNPEICGAMKGNAMKPFSNDLLFDLMAGLLNADPDNFEAAHSLASARYAMTPESTLVYLGSLRVADDKNFNAG